jgi:hypothetical protein
MGLGERIRQLGFRRWYERQLIESHAYLVTCFLCMLVVAATLEGVSFREPGVEPFALLTLAFGGGALSLFSWGRYKITMSLAERLADHATCPRCRAYGAFTVTAWGPHGDSASSGEAEAEAAQAWLQVRCRKCGREWTMH